ncbi:MAG: hypothetical protein BGO04_06455 [Microbacterium sp. 70-38]|nr:MAG: hypothetical protein BGO04_06455 [Microbacterium sp. 70-38]
MDHHWRTIPAGRPVLAAHDRSTMEGMSTSSLPTPALQPVTLATGEAGLVPIVESGASCCGASCAIAE